MARGNLSAAAQIKPRVPDAHIQESALRCPINVQRHSVNVRKREAFCARSNDPPSNGAIVIGLIDGRAKTDSLAQNVNEDTGPTDFNWHENPCA